MDKYAIAIPNYENFGIKGPYFGDLVWNHLKDIDSLSRIEFEIFNRADGTEKVRAHGSATDKKIYIIHPQYLPPAQHVMVGEQMIDSLRRAGAEKIFMLEPYNPYYSEDKRDAFERDPVTASIVLRDYSKAQRIITFDAHTTHLELGFDAFDNIPLSGVLGEYTKTIIEDISTFKISPPDAGSVKRAKKFARYLGLELISFIEKERIGNDETKINLPERAIETLDEVKGYNILIRDDVIRTGGTILKSAELLRKAGAKEIYAVATHLGLYGDTRKKFKENGIKIIGTNTIPCESDDNVYVLDVSNVAAGLIKTVINDGSVTKFLKELNTPKHSHTIQP